MLADQVFALQNIFMQFLLLASNVLVHFTCGNNYYFCLLLSLFQMIGRLEYFHNKNFIHRDIKPDNFLMGISKSCNKVQLTSILHSFKVDKQHLHRWFFSPWVWCNFCHHFVAHPHHENVPYQKLLDDIKNKYAEEPRDHWTISKLQHKLTNKGKSITGFYTEISSTVHFGQRHLQMFDN